ncbi:DUF2510 domain-containing protein [Streptomyces sodiiphilus]
MTTPPGWYPDPAHPGGPPAPERWWDGSSWTGHVRAPGTWRDQVREVLASAGRGGLIALFAGGTVVLTAVVALVVALVLGGTAASPSAAGTGPAASASEDGAREPGADEERRSEEDREPGGPGHTPGSTAAGPGGVVLPLFDGWEERGSAGGGTGVTIEGYPCPASPDLGCVRGAAFLHPLPGGGQFEPREIAEADIGANAEESYSEAAYRGVTGHEEVLSERVTVAGQDGYRVRWRLRTGVGTEAYVESVAFPAPDGSGALLLRIGFNIEDGAPPAGDMDRIVEGARAVTGSGPGTDV